MKDTIAITPPSDSGENGNIVSLYFLFHSAHKRASRCSHSQIFSEINRT